MGDSFDGAASRAARLEEIAQRREEIELRRLQLEEQHLAREEERLLALSEPQPVIRVSASDIIDLTEESPSPHVKQETTEATWRVRDNSDGQHQAHQSTPGLYGSDQSQHISVEGTVVAPTLVSDSIPTSSSSLPRGHLVQVARTIKTEVPDPIAAQSQPDGRPRPSVIGRPAITDSPNVSKSSSAEIATSRSRSSDKNTTERRTKNKNRKEKEEKDQSSWYVTDDPNYRTSVKTASGNPDEVVELRCYLCNGNYGRNRFISGPSGFLLHVRMCHPDEHPAKDFMSLKQVVELCGRRLSRDVVDGILSKRAARYQLPQIRAQKAPAHSSSWRAIDVSAASAAAKRKRKRSSDGSEAYNSDEEDMEQDSEGASGEMFRWRATSTRRSGPQLVWTKKMGTHPVAESDFAGDSDEE